MSSTKKAHRKSSSATPTSMHAVARASSPPPWEPYKAATTSTRIIPPNSESLLACFRREGLVKYKVATDLDAFNSSRPGCQFDPYTDLKMIPTLGSPTSASSSPFGNGFMDARFYTDATFHKLANQLKSRLQNSSSVPPGTPQMVKPINIVGPYIPKTETTTTTPLSTQSESSRQAKPISPASMPMSSQLDYYEKQLQYMELQLQGMQEQMSIQTQVNQELKKMLVAAIGGEDMQYRLERLVSDKQRFEIELANNAARIDRMSEQIDQTGIQCDLWRTKFLAAKLMNDELATCNQSEKVIKNLLNDNDLLNAKLNTALSILTSSSSSISTTTTTTTTTTPITKPSLLPQKSQNNLQLINVLLSKLAQLDSVKSKQVEVLAKINATSPTIVAARRSKTLNELMAHEALEQLEWVKATTRAHDTETATADTSTLDRLEVLIKQIKKSRSYKFSRLYQPESMDSADIMLNVCNRCKGDIKTV